MPGIDERYAAFHARYPAHLLTIGEDSWRLFDTQAGQSAILMLPGALGRGETAFEYIAAMAPTYRVLSPDYPVAFTSMGALADGLAKLLDARGIQTASVVGGSFGGLVAQALAAQHPDRVARLVLTDTTAPTPIQAPFLSALAAIMTPVPSGMPFALVRSGMRNYLAGMPEEEHRFWQAHFHEMLSSLKQQDLIQRARLWADFDRHYAGRPDRQHDVLIVTADDDRIVTPTAQRALLRRYPDAISRTIHGGGHAASLARAADYIALIQEFLGAEALR